VNASNLEADIPKRAYVTNLKLMFMNYQLPKGCLCIEEIDLTVWMGHLLKWN
jgi:hypothetical protein